jgi:hypothetical protein
MPSVATGDRSGTGSGGNDSGRNRGKDDGSGGDDYYEEVEFDPLVGFNDVLQLAVLRSHPRHDGGSQGCSRQGGSVALVLRSAGNQIARNSRGCVNFVDWQYDHRYKHDDVFNLFHGPAC